MSQAIGNKSAKVVIVESSSSNRQMLINLWKHHGFKSISGTASLKDALEILEVEEIDWIVTPLFSEEPENGYNLLDACTKHHQLQHLQVSLFLESSEMEILPSAFAKGLFSWHPSPFTKESMDKELTTLVERTQQNIDQPSLASAHYLRDYLKGANKQRELLLFEKKLLQHFPTKTSELLRHHAEASFIAGDTPGAEISLRQLEFLDPDQKGDLERIRLKYRHDGDLKVDTDNTSRVNLLGINNCVIVDNDTSVQNSIRELLLELGVEQVEAFNDGETASDWIKDNKGADLVIQEWRIPRLTGPYFLQRAMSEGALTSPFIVYSSLLKDDDVPFVREMGVANVIQKPMIREKFAQSLFWTIQQDRVPSDAGSLERKIRILLKANKLENAKPLIKKMLKNPKIPFGKKLQLRAEVAYLMGDYNKARELCIESIKQNGDSLLSFNLLGKSLMMLRDFPAALKCMKKAQDLSPHNIERLCNIAEAHSELGEENSAQETLSNAKSMDSKNKQVQATELDIAIASGEKNKAKDLLNSLDSVREFIAYTNNKAVACARCGFFEEGMDHYRKVLAVLDESHGNYRSIITYNLAMAYARAGEFELAKRQAMDVLTFKDSQRLIAKAKSLIKKVDQAIEDGDSALFTDSLESKNSSQVTETEVQVSEPTSRNSQEEEAGSQKKSETTETQATKPDLMNEELAEVLHEPGERGCYLLFSDAGTSTPLATKLQSQIMRFVPRAVIEKKESGGADKLFSASS